MIHEAFIYRSDEEYVDVLGSFVRDGLAAGQPVVVVATEERTRLLQGALGADAKRVEFFDAVGWYTRPGSAISAWEAALEACGEHGGLVRAVGEVQFGTDPGAVRRWTRYESLVNRLFAARNAWVFCPYDARTLPEAVVADCRRTHPVVSESGGRGPSPAHFKAGEVGAVLARGGGGTDEELTRTSIKGEGDLAGLRAAIVWPARAAGLVTDVVHDLVLAVTEHARDALASSEQPVTVRTARAGDEWFCEVATSTGAASGGAAFGCAGLGLAIGRVIADRVDVADDSGGVIRFVFTRAQATPRERILAAAADLFGREGVRSTSINAIAAQARVAKATFYSQFSSKAELVSSWLETASAAWLEGLRAEVEARTEDPVERLTAFFDVLGEWMSDDISRGAPLLNASAEALDPRDTGRVEHGRAVAREYDYLLELADAAGVANPDALAAELLLLTRGAMVQAAATSSAEPARVAATAAGRLVASANASA